MREIESNDPEINRCIENLLFHSEWVKAERYFEKIRADFLLLSWSVSHKQVVFSSTMTRMNKLLVNRTPLITGAHKNIFVWKERCFKTTFFNYLE